MDILLLHNPNLIEDLEYIVSILILMDILLLPLLFPAFHPLLSDVSILILMDILLLLLILHLIKEIIKCFNPYFNGYTTFT